MILRWFAIVCGLLAMQVYASQNSLCTTLPMRMAQYPQLGAWFLFQRAQCAFEQENKEEAHSVLHHLLRDPVLGIQPHVLETVIPYVVQSGKLSDYLHILKQQWPSWKDQAFKNLKDKNQVAKALVWMVLNLPPHDPFQATLLAQLYVEFAETKWSQVLFETRWAEAFMNQQPFERRLKRAQQLVDKHMNDPAILLLRQLLEEKPEHCETHYALAKSLRKKRQYEPAFQEAFWVKEQCPKEKSVDGWFLMSQIDWLRNRIEGISSMQELVRAFPHHTYVDDVLLFQAELYKRSGNLKEALSIYEQILSSPLKNSDKREEARIQSAFLLAQEGKTEMALKRLADVQEDDRLKLQKDQARYWHARLQLYPNLTSPGKPIFSQKALDEFKHLAMERPTSYYGFLSFLMLKHVLDQNDYNAFLEEIKNTWLKRLTASNLVAYENADLSLFKQANLIEEAKYFIETKNGSTLEKAKAYEFLGDAGQAHALLRNGGIAYLAGSPGAPLDLSLWRLAYGKAYEKAIVSASNKTQIPLYLLWGLSREESGFDESAISTAGARGLFQLMPQTAFSIAKAAKLPKPTLEQLLEPHTNAWLGSLVLKEEWSRLKHPFLVIGAYNAGPGAVKKWVFASKTCFVDWFVETIPVEQTRTYIKKVSTTWFTYAFLEGDFGLLTGQSSNNNRSSISWELPFCAK